MAQINKPNLHFNTVLYTGTGSTLSVTGVNFKPDWVWIKGRNDGQYNHQAFDIVRGADQALIPNATTAEGDYDSFNSFDSDGFSLPSALGTNVNSTTYVSWNWLADNTSGSSNTDGSITSTVAANTTSGFSIVSYTGTGTGSPTVGHGLGVAPKVIIIKCRSSSGNWGVGHASAGWSVAGVLNDTFSFGSSTYFASTNPTSSVFSIENNTVTNINGATHIAYCFAEKKGFSKFGSYTGNGNTDGPFIYTGFKPAFVIVKGSSNSDRQWIMLDNKRNPYNPENLELRADSVEAEVTQERFHFLSNGIKITNNLTYVNGSGETYVYMAFAENPLVGTNNIPATAR